MAGKVPITDSDGKIYESHLPAYLIEMVNGIAVSPVQLFEKEITEQ